ncbi:threonine aldolase [Oscillospiraceae bacterium]|nr:threonine aldolase [Oscillospiraceae bacterium]BDF76570.1 threonine aldolase [Oscillospiraceae bacterium]
MKYIDVRSDTVTTPTQEMREAMYAAEVGDDVIGDDPTVAKLQELGAGLFGKEACLITTSGTMSNQTAVLSLTNKCEQIVVHDKSHMYNLEVAGLAQICGVQARAIPAPGGVYDLAELEANILKPAIQSAPTTLVCIENTFDLNQGLIVSKEHIDAVCAVAHRSGVPVYMDGARVLNAAVALGMDPAELCASVDVVSLCLSKALACPIGSIMMGPRDVIAKARVMRQMLGGGWRQAGIVAAAGIVGLSHYQDLRLDHEKAAVLAKGLKALGLGIDMAQVQTNVVRIDVAGTGMTAQAFCARLEGFGVKAKPVGPTYVRMICHKDLTPELVPAVLQAVERCIHAKKAV